MLETVEVMIDILEMLLALKDFMFGEIYLPFMKQLETVECYLIIL